MRELGHPLVSLTTYLGAVLRLIDRVKILFPHLTPCEVSAESRCVVVGLGNPGNQYAVTRHNAGFMALDALAYAYEAETWENRLNSMIAEKAITADDDDIQLVLAKPQTMVNQSGDAVKQLLECYKLKGDGLIVIHDDSNLPAGTLCVKYDGDHGSHSGIRDIIGSVGTAFYQIAIGVGQPPEHMSDADYALQLLSDDELEELRINAARAALATQSLLEKGLEFTQNKFNEQTA